MGGDQAYRDIVVFLAVYLLLSLVPFLVVHRDQLDVFQDRLTTLDPLPLVVFVAAAVAVTAGLVLAREGIDRYNQFLFAPTDLLSVLIELSFVVAAVSWWAVPELVSRVGWSLTLDLLLISVLLCQLPMILFLSLMTVVGKA